VVLPTSDEKPDMETIVARIKDNCSLIESIPTSDEPNGPPSGYSAATDCGG
jgi:hypothetical protein